MPSDHSSEKREKCILLISFTAGLIMALMELAFAIYSNSHSSMMDAVYDSTELIFIALILFLTPLFHQPISEKRPYGFFQIESIFLIIKGVMMLSVTLTVATGIIQSALTGGNSVNGTEVSLFQLILGVISMGVYWLMHKLNRSLASPTVDAELLGWKLDIWYSLGLAVAFFVSTYLEQTPLAPLTPYFDPVVAVLIVIGMLPENVKLLIGAIRDIFLFSPEEDTIEQVKALCEQTLGEYHMKAIFYDVTRTGRHLWVSVYFSIPGNLLRLSTLQEASAQLNEILAAELDNCSCELIPRQQEDGFLMPEPDPEPEPLDA